MTVKKPDVAVAPKSTVEKVYAEAGVDVAAGDALVDWLQSSAESAPTPHADRVLSGIGGFASLFRIGFPNMRQPCLVTCTDGVGTKVKLAVQFQRYREVAQDCVAMCVNDLICSGGRPLLFLDYYATGKLDLRKAQEFLIGLREACTASDCALVGGETAEMPGVYQGEDFDCAGFAVGIVDEPERLGEHRVAAGDRVMGISSSGFHSNGYSLLRRVFAADLEKWADQLLVPTALYVSLMRKLQESCELHAAAHITGGGIENIPRVVPANLQWKPQWWKFPEIFLEVQRRTGAGDDEMRRTLNCGIGFVLILPASAWDQATKIVQQSGHLAYDLGHIQ